ncbi:MAG: CopG family transcriptional regulator [Pseudomonadota bacterium]|nr:CopG family transcriptional regulator [Pseudomonadota bacterium]
MPASPEEEAAFRAAVQEGLHDVAAGRVISGEAILAWLRSWGTENELPRPECGD